MIMKIEANILRLNLDERNVRNLGLTNVMVVFEPPEIAKSAYKGTPLVDGQEYLFLGEIKNMPGHGIFVDQKSGKTLFGYHMDNFWLKLEGVQFSMSTSEYGDNQVDVEERDYDEEVSEDDEP